MNEECTQDLDRPSAVDAPTDETVSRSDPAGADETATAAFEALPPCDPPDEAAAPDLTDPEPAAGADPRAAAELAELRSELTRLREELTRKEAISLRLGRDCAEFEALYPDVPLSEIPDGVWESVKQGIPLAAAFALAERRRERLETVARDSNRRNRDRSSGELSRETPDYFSYEEVRRMSSAEVRAHYDSILRSMKRWG